MKVLIADDHHLFRAGLRYVLEPLGSPITILEASSHAQVATLIETHPDIDLVLVDLYMPSDDARNLFDILSSQSQTMPIVVLSASEDRRDLRRVLDAGAMGFIPKSTSPEIMLGALRLVLAGGVYIPPMLLTESAGDGSLSARQQEILRCMAEGLPNKAIARDLGISISTVKAHVATIFRVLNVADRVQAIKAAARLGLKANHDRGL